MLKKISIAFVGLLVLLLVIPNFIDWNQYKSSILEQVEKSSGIKVNVSGNISLSLVPMPKLKVEGISVKNAEHSQKENIAEVKALSLSVELLPLLSGKINVHKVELIEPRVFVENKKDGRANWQELIDKTNQSSPSSSNKSATSNTGGGSSVNLKVQNVSIVDGFVSSFDAATQKKIEVSGINLSGGIDSLTGPFDFKIGLMYDGYEINGTVNAGAIKNDLPESIAASIDITKGKTSFGEVKINAQQKDQKFQGTVQSNALKLPVQFMLGDKKIDLQKGVSLSLNFETNKIDHTISNLQVGYDGLTLNGQAFYGESKLGGDFELKRGQSQLKLNINAKGQGGAYDGQVDLKLSNPHDLLQWMGQGEVSTYLGKNVAVRSALKIKPSVVELSSLHMDVAGLNGKGSIAVDMSKKVPHINAQINLPQLNYAKLNIPTSASSTSKSSGGNGEKVVQKPASQERWSSEKIDLSALKSLQLSLKLGIDQLHYKPYSMSNLRLDLRIDHGALKINSLTAQGYGGKIQATVSLDKNSLSLNSQVHQINLSALPDVKNSLLKKATLDASIDVNSRGNSILEYVNSLSGRSSIKLSGGVVEACDIKQFVAEIKQAKDISAVSKIKSALSKKALVNFSRLGGDFHIQNGSATTNNFELITSEGSMKAQGAINLSNWIMDLSALISLNELPQLPPLGVKVSGSIDNPSYGVDQAQLMKILAQGVMNRVVADVKKNIAQKLADKLPIPGGGQQNGGAQKPQEQIQKAIGKILPPKLSGIFG